ncbi:endocuticle structural glycoprotein ABD-4-like [Copidosoma floridanum]|uniref:endocuticle structural glycoprotein ABD-4-like n=1 Tax=Copidosoma floridanum TaxID=29053 RepID=UPI0006C96422|nr:endocuticle structural glycoprotein ABD-4-like [Copidosoma floridanum]
MYATLVTLSLLACASAAPAEPQGQVIPIVSQTQEGPNPDGSYKWAFESGNGIKANEEGHVKNAGSENEAMEAQGGFSYKGDDGVDIQMTYIADENGFQPVGAHIPTPPPIPEAIKRALEWIEKNPSPEDKA